MQSVSNIITEILAREGSQYTDHPSDKGGPTKYGITLATLAEYRGGMVVAADVRNLGELEARKIYESRYIDRPRFNLVLQVDTGIGLELIDTGVNMGVSVAATFLQRALNLFNERGRTYPDLKVDGNVGPATVAALRSFIARRGRDGIDVLLKTLNLLQGARYVEIAERHEAQEDFIYGWIKVRA